VSVQLSAGMPCSCRRQPRAVAGGGDADPRTSMAGLAISRL